MKLSLTDILPLWWAWLWRSTVLGFVGGVAFGFVAGFMLGLFGFPEQGPLVGGLAGYAWGLVASILMLRVALSKTYKRFSISIVPLPA